MIGFRALYIQREPKEVSPSSIGYRDHGIKWLMCALPGATVCRNKDSVLLGSFAHRQL
jgi:hypothetical protein